MTPVATTMLRFKTGERHALMLLQQLQDVLLAGFASRDHVGPVLPEQGVAVGLRFQVLPVFAVDAELREVVEMNSNTFAGRF